MPAACSSSPIAARREISHGGATGGYRAFLARYPETRLSVALLCNVASANAEALAHQVADLFLPAPAQAPAAGAASVPAPAGAAGTYVNERTGMPLRLAIEDGKLRIVGGPVFESAAPNLFRFGRTELRFADEGSFTLLTPDGQDAPYARAEAYPPDAAALGAFLGRYASAEAGAEYVVTLQEGKLALRSAERPHLSVELVPAYRDAFTAPGALFRFRRDRAGRVITLSAGNARVRDLSFSRVSPAQRRP